MRCFLDSELTEMWYFIGSVSTVNALFGQGLGPIGFSSFRCTGNEAQLFDCPKSTPSIYSCGHRDDAGVKCHTRESKRAPSYMTFTMIG